MAEVGERKKLSHGLLSCFCGHGITKEEPVQSAVSDEDGITTRSSRTSTAAAVDHNLLGKIAGAFKELAEVVAAASNNAEEVVEVAAFARACSFVAPLFGLVGFHFKFIEMDYVTKVNDLMEASKSFKTLESMVDEDVKTNTVRKQGSHSRNLLKIKRGLDFLRLLFDQILLTETQIQSLKKAIEAMKLTQQAKPSEFSQLSMVDKSGIIRNIPTRAEIKEKKRVCRSNLRETLNIVLNWTEEKRAILGYYPIAKEQLTKLVIFPDASPSDTYQFFQGNSVRDAVSKAYTEIFHLRHGWALRKAVSSRLHHIPTKQQLFRKLNQDESSGRVLMQAYVTASPALLQYIDNIFSFKRIGYRLVTKLTVFCYCLNFKQNVNVMLALECSLMLSTALEAVHLIGTKVDHISIIIWILYASNTTMDLAALKPCGSQSTKVLGLIWT
ncbi:hypothetical protein Ahy_Scaffold6g107860 isoform A [Arachis hypogaea]|uniref:Glycolipid transfer protein domain-containing protein n=1 Tax=Arachis hypogaea TaxID=3818 RepID=A0A444WPB7_ARAHY|nr:hypothetical protein Ahy_Scaffold6g107860 isoform A [Arachis hypogaea]